MGNGAEDEKGNKLRKIVTILTIGAALYMAACTQKEKENTTSLDEDLDELNNSNDKETENWTAEGYWPTEGKFEIDENGTITVFTDGKDEVIIPARINGVPVKAIGSLVFRSMGLTDVTLPAGLTSIGWGAFYDNKLTAVTIPDSVIHIGRDAFNGNPLAYVSIPTGALVEFDAFPSSLENDAIEFDLGADINFDLGALFFTQDDLIAFYAYYEYFCNDRKAGTYVNSTYTSKKEGDFEFVQTRYGAIITGYTSGKIDQLEIPRKLGGVAVKGIILYTYNSPNIGLSSLQLPDGLTFIAGYGAFSYNQLTSVTIPESVIYIGDNAFAHNQLTSVDIGKNVSFIEWCAFYDNKLTAVTIPDSVIHIGGSAFHKNLLTTVIIGNGVTRIDGGAFKDNQLTSVTIPDNVTFRDGGQFEDNKLTSITIGSDVKLGFNRSFDNSFLSYGYYGKSFDYIYENNRKKAGTYILSNNQWSMTVPPVQDESDFKTDGKGTITAYTGSDLWITIPSLIGNMPVTEIGPAAFAKKKLISVTIPDGIIYIGEEAFGDNALTSVIIPDSVTDIDMSAFGHNRLRNITIGSDVNFEWDFLWDQDKEDFIHFYTFYDINESKAGTYMVVPGKGWQYVDE
jgi:hypothetical protein